jgi:aminopeptidase-like protein
MLKTFNALWVYPSIFCLTTIGALSWMAQTEQVREWVRRSDASDAVADLLCAMSMWTAVLTGLAVSVILGHYVLCYL